jgi:hypothetical protein
MIPRLYRGAVELSAFAASAAAIGPPRRTTQFTGTFNLANIGEVCPKAPGALIAGMFARTIPFSGWLSDQIGRKKMYVTSAEFDTIPDQRCTASRCTASGKQFCVSGRD